MATIARPSTTFIGRREILHGLGQSIAQARLVTVVGPPGVGKTRLVKQYALALATTRATPRGGVLFCDLTEAATIKGAIARIASVAVPDPSESPSSDETRRRIAAALCARDPTLLILDNFEQLVRPAGALVGELVDATPDATRFIVTSRQRLGVAGEVVVELPPLTLPAASHSVDSEAVDLFLQRARAALPGFDATESELGHVAQLVRLLDGLPLAIELAAARVPILAPAELIERIGNRFGWLTQSHSTERARPATLWETIEASWTLLAPWERAALAQVSVFRGGFTVGSAESVLDLRAFADAPPALDVLQSLRDKSLLAVEQADVSAKRFMVLSSIRDFAEATLEPPALDETWARHARHFVRLGESLCAQLELRDDSETRMKLRLENENLLAVHQRLLGARTPADLQSASLSAALILARIGSSFAYPVTLHALDGALAVTDETADNRRLIARALEARGNARRFVGQIAESGDDFQRMLKLAAAEGDQGLVASALSGLGNAATVRARWDEAREHFEKALAMVVAAKERRAEGRLLAMLGATRFNQDDPAAARALLLRALELMRETNDRPFEGVCVTSLGIVSGALGSLADARRHLSEALTLHRELGSRHWEGVTLSYLALAEQEEGRLAKARALYAEALAILSETGVRRAEGLALAAWAGACLLDGLLDEARQRYRRALDIARIMSPDHEGLLLACLGVVAALEGDTTAAGDAFDGAERSLAGHRRPAFAAAVQVHRGHLGLARARSAAPGDRAAGLGYARARLSLAESQAGRSAEVRFARDLLARCLRAFEAERPSIALLVGANGVWFKLPGGKRAVRLHRRRALYRLVYALADQRLRAPGVAMSIPELVEHGWPGERMRPEAGTERVYTAIATLRKLGLRKVLLSSDDGYLFDPQVGVVRSPSSTPPG